jgi:hypothetical protein
VMGPLRKFTGDGSDAVVVLDMTSACILAHIVAADTTTY